MKVYLDSKYGSDKLRPRATSHRRIGGPGYGLPEHKTYLTIDNCRIKLTLLVLLFYMTPSLILVVLESDFDRF